MLTVGGDERDGLLEQNLILLRIFVFTHRVFVRPYGTLVPVEEPSTASIADIVGWWRNPRGESVVRPNDARLG